MNDLDLLIEELKNARDFETSYLCKVITYINYAIYGLILVFLLSACGKADNGQSSPSKTWAADVPNWSTNTDFSKDMQVSDWMTAYGQVCQAFVALDLVNHTIQVSNATQISAASGNDILCSNFDFTGTYLVNGSSVQVCPASQPCVTFN